MSFFVSKEIEDIIDKKEIVGKLDNVIISNGKEILCEGTLIGIKNQKIKIKTDEINDIFIFSIFKKGLLFTLMYKNISIKVKFFAYKEKTKNNYKQIVFKIYQGLQNDVRN
tara:strand:- start:146 stop:478 length:333 start_codon:yes stop_codon:yes gene_type:complete